MPHSDKLSDGDAWFVYARRAGRISAVPANARGWLALIACLIMLIGIGWAVAGVAATLHPLAGVAAMAVVIVLGVLLIMRLAVAKGRRID